MAPFHSIHETDAVVVTGYEDVESLLEDEDLTDQAEKIHEHFTLIEGPDGLPESLVSATLYECGDEWILGLMDIEDATYIYRGQPPVVLDVMLDEYDRFGVEDEVVTEARQSDDPVAAMRRSSISF